MLRARIIAAFGGALLCISAAARDRGTWIGTWESSPTALSTVENPGSVTRSDPVIAKGTICYRLRISRGGSHIRLKFSNELGKAPLALTSATVAMAAAGLNVVSESLRAVTFAGRPSISIPAGAPALSDSIDFPVKALADVVVSVYLGAGPTHGERSAANACGDTLRPIVSEIDVLVDRVRPVVVALGDSITDGRLIPETGDRGWPGTLSRRLQAAGISVVNAGIGGNRLLESLAMYGEAALARFDRDVLTVPGVSHIVLLEGTNDIGMSGPGGMFGDTRLVDTQTLIGAYSQIIARAHELGIEVIGATIPPFEGSLYYTADREKVRVAINRWIRAPGNFDGLVDFAAVLQDPDDAGKLNSPFDSGDHLHPSPAGFQQMGDAVNLTLFRP